MHENNHIVTIGQCFIHVYCMVKVCSLIPGPSSSYECSKFMYINHLRKDEHLAIGMRVFFPHLVKLILPCKVCSTLQTYFVNNSEHQNQFNDTNDDHKIYWQYVWIVQGKSVNSRAENWREADQTITESPWYKGNILSEQIVLELRNELLMSTEQLDRIKETEATLRSQLKFAQQIILCQHDLSRLDTQPPLISNDRHIVL